MKLASFVFSNSLSTAFIYRLYIIYLFLSSNGQSDPFFQENTFIYVLGKVPMLCSLKINAGVFRYKARNSKATPDTTAKNSKVDVNDLTFHFHRT
jgi:hypothetical protein